MLTHPHRTALASYDTVNDVIDREADTKARSGFKHLGLPASRDVSPLFPSLHGRMTNAEGGGELSHAAETGNSEAGWVHTDVVRLRRTSVNIEIVRPDVGFPVSMDRGNIGAALRELRERSGVTFRDLANAMGYKNPSSIQHLFKDEYRAGRQLDLDVAKKLVTAFVGKGSPPIMPDEIFALAGMTSGAIAPQNEGAAFNLDAANLPGRQQMPKDIPVYGTAFGASLDVIDGSDENGGFVAIEQTTLDRSEPIDFLRRTPAMSKKRDLYGVIVRGSSMAPRFDDGDTVLVDPHYPAKIGDDVIVQLHGPDGQDGDQRVVAVLIKRLVRRSASWIELEQFNPPLSFRLDMKCVGPVDRIVPLGEVIGV